MNTARPSLGFLSRATAALLAASLVLTPMLAEAKAGKSSSMGSRGTRTFQQNNAQPLQRSTTPPPPAAAPQAPVQSAPLSQPQAARPAMPAAPVAQPSFFQRHPFLSGMMGGLVGAGIGSMLFGGGSFFGQGAGGFIGLILQILLIVFVVKLLIGFFRRRSNPAAYEAAPQQADYDYQAQNVTAVAPTRPANPLEFQLGAEDLQILERLLIEVQTAWSRGDIPALGRMMSPEMAGYMDELLRQDRDSGLQNIVEQVHLTHGNVDETWREGGVEYATVTLSWTAIDYTLRIGTNQVVDGDRSNPVETTEVWTVFRQPGRPWILTAIQQK